MFKRFAFTKSLALVLALASSSFAAEQALKVEELLSEKNNFKADLSLSYSNIDQDAGVSTVVTIDPLGLGGLLGLTTYMSSYAGDQVVDRDILVYSLNAKYGITDRLELVLFGNAHSAFTRVQLGSAHETDSDSDFDNAGFGLTYKVKSEGSTPALLLGATTNAISRVQYAAQNEEGQLVGTDKQNEYFDSYNFYALSYYSVDPVVFVLKAAYQWSREQSYDDSTINHADVVSLTPEIYFAVNPYTNLSWGISYKFIGEESVNGDKATNAESVIGFKLGVSYEIVRNSIITVEGSKNDASTYSQSTINIMYSKRF
jgi:hypothetical protein